MQIIKDKNKLIRTIREWETQDERIGFVPTMGYLHEGHLKLMEVAHTKATKVIVSIFVNPLQFNEKQDYQSYPVDIARDSKLCEAQNVDVLFLPTNEDLYPINPRLEMSMPSLLKGLCGRARPGHLEGVLNVILRFTLLLSPHYIFLGKKDYQQCIVISQLLQELPLVTQATFVPTVREKDGLPLASRNARLSKEARISARLMSEGLAVALEKHKEQPFASAQQLCSFAAQIIESALHNKIDYIEVVDLQNLEKIEDLRERNFLFAVAIFCDGVRILDNMEYHYTDMIQKIPLKHKNK